MRAAICHAYGPPETLVIEDVDEPVAGPGEVVVETRAASVNFPDVLIMADKYQVSVPTPFIPGNEFAGVVREVGPGADLQPGDAVYGTAWHGAFAERIRVASASVTPLPPTLDFAEGAAFGVAYITAYHGLRSVAEVSDGDWVVVTGAAGGVGSATIDIARCLGARVIALASTEKKRALCIARGAEYALDYRTEDVKNRIKEITGDGADAVVDQVGGPWAEQALRATKWGGRFVTVGYASGEIPRIPLNLVLLKGVVVKGFEVRTFSHYAPEAAERDRRELGELVAAGRIHPHIGARFPLERAAEALRVVGDGRALGKVVVEMPGS